MNREELKEQREIDIFRKFANLSDLDIVLSSIEHRPPPEPDVICKIRKEGVIRFELTEACAPEFAKAINNPSTEGVDVCFTDDATKETVLKKLDKSYPVIEPVDLLVYTDGGTAKSDLDLEYDITDALQEKKGPFRKIWLMGDNVYVYFPVRS